MGLEPWIAGVSTKVPCRGPLFLVKGNEGPSGKLLCLPMKCQNKRTT